MNLVVSLLVLSAGCGIWLYQFLIIAYLFTFGKNDVAPAAKLKNDRVNKVEKWQKLTAGLNPNHVHIFKPWKKNVQTCIKIGMTLYKDLCSQSTIVCTLFIESCGQKMTKVHKVEKVTKINSRIVSKLHAHLQTMEKTCAKFQKDYKMYEEFRSQGTHCLYTFIDSEVRKWQSSQTRQNGNSYLLDLRSWHNTLHIGLTHGFDSLILLMDF